MFLNTPTPERQETARWLAQAASDYQRLASSLATLGSQLAALGVNIELAQPAFSPVDASVASGQAGIAPPNVSVYLLGPFKLLTGDRAVRRDVPGQVQTVLKYLVSQKRRPVSRDAVIDLLWPNVDPSVAQRRLRVLMHTVRKSIPCDHLGFKDLVILSGNNFLLNPEARLWVDVEEFESHWHKGWRLARAGAFHEALGEYEKAEALYVGDYLQDEPYADWTLLRREALRDAYATILTMLATMSFEAGDYTGSIIWSQKLLAQDECREDAYRTLIASHSRIGQYSRAAHWYNACASTLKRELGLDLSSETRQLFNSLDAGAVDPVWLSRAELIQAIPKHAEPTT